MRRHLALHRTLWDVPFFSLLDSLGYFAPSARESAGRPVFLAAKPRFEYNDYLDMFANRLNSLLGFVAALLGPCSFFDACE